MLKKKILLPMMLVLAIGLVGCTTPKNETPPETTPPVVDETPGEDTPVEEATDDNKDEETPEENIANENTAMKISPEEAFDKYVEKYPNTMVRKLQLDTDYGEYVYKVKGYEGNNEYVIKVDSNSGEVLKDEQDNDDDDYSKDGELTRANVEKIQAIVNKEMQDAGTDAKLDEWTLKAKNGRAMLEVEIDREGMDDIEHTYDVETGELVDSDD